MDRHLCKNVDSHNISDISDSHWCASATCLVLFPIANDMDFIFVCLFFFFLNLCEVISGNSTMTHSYLSVSHSRCQWLQGYFAFLLHQSESSMVKLKLFPCSNYDGNNLCCICKVCLFLTIYLNKIDWPFAETTDELWPDKLSRWFSRADSCGDCPQS